MVTLISLVADEKSLQAYKHNLENNQGGVIDEIYLGVAPELKERASTLSEDILEISPSIVQEADIDKLIKTAHESLAPHKKVFLLNNTVGIPLGAISQLEEDYDVHLGAGFISGLFSEYAQNYLVDDLYSDSPDLKSLEEPLTGTVKIDTALPQGLVTKAQTLAYWKRTPELQSLTFGIQLRKLGFMNYINTEIKYKYIGGEK